MTVGLVTTVASMAGISQSSARRVAASASHRYKSYYIPKRKGGRRLVAQPAREVKALQRALVTCLRESLRVHPAATAYEVDRSILKNAELHAAARYLLKLDFENFFPSIDENSLHAYLINSSGNAYTASEINFIGNLALWRRAGVSLRSLCIGAPSSPFLSNAIMYDIDASISQLCESRRVVYSRYSDDITLSAVDPYVLEEIERGVRAIVGDAPYPSLRFNDRKRVSVSRNTAMTVTGLTLTNQGAVSVGRDRKRGVRAGIDRLVHGRLGADEVLRLRGEVAFVLSIEPAFRYVLLKTYGRACERVMPKQGSESTFEEI